MGWDLGGLIDSNSLKKWFGIGAEPEGGEVTQATTLLPEQQQLLSQLSSYILPRIGTSASSYTGQTVAGMTPEESSALARLRTLTGQDTSAVDTALLKALSGTPTTSISPETTEQYYQSSIVEPTMRDFRENILPLLEESYAGGPGYFSSARAGAREKALQDLSSDLLSQRAELFYKDEEAKRNLAETAADRMLSAVSTAGSLSTSRQQEQLNLLEAESLQRTLDQAQLDFDYKEFLRTQPESAPYLNLALSLLGIQGAENIVSSEYFPTTIGDILMQAASAASSAASTGAGI